MVLGGGGGAGAGSEIRRMDMQEEGGGGMRLSKRFSDKGGEVDYKTKAGTAWSHSYLNQKPWHPLSYPNQRRKWIAEQTDAQRDRRAQEVAREVSAHIYPFPLLLFSSPILLLHPLLCFV